MHSFSFFSSSFWVVTKNFIIIYTYAKDAYKTGVRVVAWNKSNCVLLGTPHQRRNTLDLPQPKYTLVLKATLLILVQTQGHSPGSPSAGQLPLNGKVSRMQNFPFLTQKEEAVCLRIDTPWCSLAEHTSNSLKCRVRAKLEIHLPSTSCADYLEHVFLIHLHITHPGGVARAMWWPKEPNEFLLYFKKQVSLCWLSLRAKKLHSSSPVTSKWGSVN